MSPENHGSDPAEDKSNPKKELHDDAPTLTPEPSPQNSGSRDEGLNLNDGAERAGATSDSAPADQGQNDSASTKTGSVTGASAQKDAGSTASSAGDSDNGGSPSKGDSDHVNSDEGDSDRGDSQQESGSSGGAAGDLTESELVLVDQGKSKKAQDDGHDNAEEAIEGWLNEIIDYDGQEEEPPASASGDEPAEQQAPQKLRMADTEGRPVQLPAAFMPTVEHFYVAPNAAFFEAPTSNIVFVKGPPNSGKYFGALGYVRKVVNANETTERKIFRMEFPPTSRSRSLFDTFSDLAKFEENSVVLIQNYFESDFAAEELKDDRLSSLSTILAKKNLLLVVTINSDRNRDFHMVFNNYTVLSTDWESEEMPEPVVPSITQNEDNDPARQKFIGDVFETHLRYYNFLNPGVQIANDRLAQVEELKLTIAKTFRSPSQVKLLFGRLAELPSAESNQAVVDLVTEISALESGQNSPWFRKLSPNHQLYALLVALFEEMPLEFIHQIYAQFCRQLKNERFSIRDHRKVGHEDLKRKISIQSESIDGTELEVWPRFRFVNEQYRREVKRQIENYRDLLWSAVVFAYGYVHKLDPDRRLMLYPHIGKAVGVLGIEHWYEFLEQVEDFIDKMPKPDALALLPATAISSVVVKRPKQVVEKLKQWVRDFNSQTYVYTGVVAIAECYNAISKQMRVTGSNAVLEKALDELEELLTSAVLFDFPHQFLHYRDSYIYAMSTLENAAPDRAIACVTSWMTGKKKTAARINQTIEPVPIPDSLTFLDSDEAEDDEEVEQRKQEESLLPAVGYFFAVQRLDRCKEIDSHSEKYVDRLFKLLGLVLRFEINFESSESFLLENEMREIESESQKPDAPIQIGLGVVQRWLNEKNASSVHARIRSILQTMNVTQRRRLKRVMQDEWLSSSDNVQVEIAESLLTFAHILDGVPIDPSPSHFGCLIVGLPRHYNTKERNDAWNIYKRLSNHLRIRLAGQGNAHWLSQDGEFANSQTFQNLDSGAPVCLPLLEDLDCQKTHFVLIIKWQRTSGQAGDIEDLMLDLNDLRPESSPLHGFGQKVIQIQDARGFRGSGLDSDADVIRWKLESRTTRNRLEDRVADMIAENLSQRTRQSCETVLSEICPEIQTFDFPDLVDRLEKTIDDLEAGSFEKLKDKGLLISGIFHWMLKADYARALKLVRRWLSRSSESRFAFARSLFQLFFQISRFGQADYDPQPVVDLGRVFLKHPEELKYEFFCLLEMLFDWSSDDGLRVELEYGALGSQLSQLFGKVPLGWREQILTRFARWRKTLLDETPPLSDTKGKSREEQEAQAKLSEERSRFVDSVENEILLGPIIDTARTQNKKVALLVVDSDPAGRSARKSIATRLFKIMREKLQGTGVTPCLYRLGITTPISVNKKIGSELLYPEQLKPRAPLLLPTLESYRTSIDQIHSVILLANRTPLDWQEVLEYFPYAGFVHCERDHVDWESGGWFQIKTGLRDVESLSKKIWEEVCRLV